MPKRRREIDNIDVKHYGKMLTSNFTSNDFNILTANCDNRLREDLLSVLD